MGLLRFLLALTVVIYHSSPSGGFAGIFFVKHIIAIQSFFMISGFYMALILNEKYVGPGSYRLFLTNRILRLFPVYWLILALSVLLAAAYLMIYGQNMILSAMGPFTGYSGLLDIKSLIYLAFSNIFILGQEASMFLNLDVYGSLEFTADFWNARSLFPKPYQFFFVMPAWTISLELTFYLLAPLLVRGRTIKLLAVIAASLGLRAYFYTQDFRLDPWLLRFFPSELAFFMIGALCYRAYRYLRGAGTRKGLYKYAFYVMAAVTLFYQAIPEHTIETVLLKHAAYYTLFAISMPFIFIYTRDKKIDYYLGELSYPIYISHLFVLGAVGYWRFQGTPMQAAMQAAAILSVIAFSVFLIHFLIRPIEKYRQARVAKKRLDAAPGGL